MGPADQAMLNFFISMPQFTSVQLILATDGDASVAVFAYEGFDFLGIQYQTGFDAGNQRIHTVIEPSLFRSIQQSTVGYRIDG